MPPRDCGGAGTEVRTAAPFFAVVLLLTGCASVAPAAEVEPSPPATLPVATATAPTATITATSVSTTHVPTPARVSPTPTATPAATVIPSLYPEALGDPREHVTHAHARPCWPPPHAAKRLNCGWYHHADLSLPDGDELLVIDEEAERTGINRWSASAPYLWIGELDSLVADLDGIELLRFSDVRAWVILYDPGWAGGWHYARAMGRLVTPGANSLWYLDDSQAQFPDDCESHSHEGWPEGWSR